MKRSLFLAELKEIGRHPMSLIQVLAIVLVPILYAGMFIWAFWDPYGRLERLPVAVVNEDKGAVMEKEKIAIGDNLIDNLKENKSMDFHFVNKKKAYNGLDNQKYYMVIEIPENFSENATTLLDKKPKQLQLKYVQNQSANYTSSKIGESAMTKIKDEVSKEVSATYAEQMFDVVKKMGDGFTDASEGASKLNDGAKQLGDGTKELKDNLETLAKSAVTFNGGVKEADSGAGEIVKGSTDLSDGLNQLNSGSNELYKASKDMQNGTNELTKGINQAGQGLEQLNEGLPELVNGTQKVQGGLKQFKNELPPAIAKSFTSQLGESAKTLNSGMDQLQTKLEAGLSSQIAKQVIDQQTLQMNQLFASLEGKVDPEVLTQLKTQMAANAEEQAKNLESQLSQGIHKGMDQGFTAFKTEVNKQMTGNSDQIAQQIKKQTDPQFDQLISGVTTINKNQVKVQKGIEQLTNGSVLLSNGAAKLQKGQNQYIDSLGLFNTKMAEASKGAEQLSKGAESLNDGLNQLADGSAKIEDGTQQLAGGSKKLNDGTKDLKDGTKEMKDKLTDASKDAGSVNGTDKQYDMMSDPVDLDKGTINKVPNYGTGLTPYFLSLGLFVGGLLLTIIFPLREPAVEPKNGFSWFIGKYGIMALVGILQALVAVWIIVGWIGVDVKSIPLFIVAAIITSLTFMALIQFLVTLLDNPGRFIAIIILILQLTSSAGTFPLELLPKVLKPIHEALPMTYSLQAFKAVISNGNYTVMWQNLGVLAIYMISFLVITLVYFIFKSKRKDKMVANEEVTV
ncbi:YhgE/Pip family protein [Heyndrickxia sp. NPDC080065]|uniref:YhgE/Pip family protein n=1 Tax=Heyndrickxia sp. NPDC080065 TaxID=3390568 RepID=UPI003D069A54